MKKCSSCQQEYSLNNYYGEDRLCKECRKSYNKKHRAITKEYTDLGRSFDKIKHLTVKEVYLMATDEDKKLTLVQFLKKHFI